MKFLSKVFMIKGIKFIAFIISLITLTSCEITQETKFETDGSGRYSMGFDMSEMMKMKGSSGSNEKQLDTLIVFSELLKDKKDSIAKLSKEEQEKIKDLENFSIAIKSDTVAKKFEMKINYNFKDVSELKTFGEKLAKQNIKELDILSNKTKSKDKDKKPGMPDFNKHYNTIFNKKMFSVKITKEGLAEAEKNKDTTITKDNPMVDMIRFKSKYLFPYKIKKINNENFKILSDFKGIEISGSLFEVNNDPKFFEVEVEFEK